jgi:hypothetical protein
MDPNARAWTEIVFNVAYLVTIWWIIFAMLRRQKFFEPKDRPIGRQFILAFILLAAGDLAHVGFRLLAFFQGQNIAEPQPGETSLLLGLGTLATSITVTLFYIMMAIIWRRRFKKPYGWFGILIILAGFARLVMMLFPQNQWTLIVPPQPWSLYRNIPLLIQGLGVAFLFLRDGFAANDRLYKWIGVLILLSFAFYLPVILFVQQVPLVGMLMIPKTISYVVIAALAYYWLFRSTLPRRGHN